MQKCKVIGCENHVMDMKEESKHETMKGTYGYCQIHNIEGLLREEGCGEWIDKMMVHCGIYLTTKETSVFCDKCREAHEGEGQ